MFNNDVIQLPKDIKYVYARQQEEYKLITWTELETRATAKDVKFAIVTLDDQVMDVLKKVAKNKYNFIVIFKHGAFNWELIDNDYAFRCSCENGYLDIAKWLFRNWPDINVHEENDYAFRWSCRNGHLDVAKWLFQTWSDINACVGDDYAFRLSCYNNHLDIAKWLVQNWPNINVHADNDFAFKCSCENGHLDVVKWLVQNWNEMLFNNFPSQNVLQYLFNFFPNFIIQNSYTLKYQILLPITKAFNNKDYDKVLEILKITEFVDIEEKNDGCSICYNNNDDNRLIIAPCGHIYCIKCLYSWWFIKQNCLFYKYDLIPKDCKRVNSTHEY